jgi:hypothetical protein
MKTEYFTHRFFNEKTERYFEIELEDANTLHLKIYQYEDYVEVNVMKKKFYIANARPLEEAHSWLENIDIDIEEKKDLINTFMKFSYMIYDSRRDVLV